MANASGQLKNLLFRKSYEHSHCFSSRYGVRLPTNRRVHRTCRFSQDLERCSVPQTTFSSPLTLDVLGVPRRSRQLRRPSERDLLSRQSRFSRIWDSTPTSSSSTRWSRPPDTSMNLQSYVLASLRPAATRAGMLSLF